MIKPSIPSNSNSAVPQCPLFGQCGGCQYQDITYSHELEIKFDQLKAVLTPLQVPANCIQLILPSPVEYGYRNRLDLKLHKRKFTKEINIGFTPMGRKSTLVADSCAIARPEISNFIPQLKEEAATKLPEKYKVANLVVRCGDDGRVHWGGIGRHSLRLSQEDYFWTKLCGHRIHYSLETFFQANLSILPSTIKALRQLPVWSKEAIFFDLYGGVGLFGMVFADLVGRVVLIEENQASVQIAKYNAAYNQLENFHLHDGRVEDVLPKLLEEFQPLPKIVMVDPPRAGLSKSSIALLNSLENVQHLMYLSCNPESLVDNLKDLQSHWEIKTVMPFDFFPRTKHLETFVLLHSLT